MPVAPDPSEIFERAVEEGERRLDQSMLELVSTSFIAGFTIVFGIAALGVVESLVKPQFGAVAKIAGALAFAVGLVFLVVGRTELFNENFFDPIAAVIENDDSGVPALLRLWAVTYLINLVGGVLIALVFAVEAVLPSGAPEILATAAEEIVHRGSLTVFASAIVGGALVSLLSFLLESVNSVSSRITMAYAVGFFIAIGPFDHVIVTTLHVVVGMLYGAPIGYGALAQVIVLATAGNMVGGIGLVTLSHVTQAIGARENGG